MDAPAPRRTRIQREKRELILEAALDVFSTHGFRGSTIDQIAEAAGMSKPNLLYYFRRKEDIHATLMQRLLDTWLAPLRELDDVGDPIDRDCAATSAASWRWRATFRAKAGSSPTRSCRARRASCRCSRAS